MNGIERESRSTEQPVLFTGEMPEPLASERSHVGAHANRNTLKHNRR